MRIWSMRAWSSEPGSRLFVAARSTTLANAASPSSRRNSRSLPSVLGRGSHLTTAGQRSSPWRETVGTGRAQPYVRLPPLISLSNRFSIAASALDDQASRHRAAQGVLAYRQSQERQSGRVGQEDQGSRGAARRGVVPRR